MKLLVTGAAGFVGQHFIQAAASHGCSIIAMCNTKSMDPNIAKLCQSIQMGGFSQFNADSIDGVDAIVNFGAYSTNVPYGSYSDCIQKNVVDPLDFFRSSMMESIPFFHIGSCFEYGPITSGMHEFIPANASLTPTGSYPLSKAMLSLSLLAIAQEFGSPLSILRLFQIFGDGEAPSRLYPFLLKQGFSGLDIELSPGDQIRDFTHVDIACQQILESVLHQKAKPNQIHFQNIASGKPSSMKEFATNIWNVNGFKGKIFFGAKPHRPNESMRIAADMHDVFISTHS